MHCVRMLHVPNSYDDLDMDEDEFKAFRREGMKRERGGVGEEEVCVVLVLFYGRIY